jgi:hypothetical protein
VQHQPRGRQLGLHVGQHPLQALEFADRPPELLPPLGEIHREVEAPAATPMATVPAPTRWLL